MKKWAEKKKNKKNLKHNSFKIALTMRTNFNKSKSKTIYVYSIKQNFFGYSPSLVLLKWN